MIIKRPRKFRVAVCMAAYNGINYIDKQLDSIECQLSDNDQLIIVDDCSTDGTYQYLCTRYTNSQRVTLRRNNTNLGPIGTFENCLKLSESEYIFLADQDDIWLPGKIDSMLILFESSSSIMCVHSNAYFHIDNFPTNEMLFDNGDFFKKKYFTHFIKNSFVGCCMAIKSDILSMAIPFPKGISMHDWWLGTLSLNLGELFYLETPTMYYRRHGANVTGKRRPISKIVFSRFSNFLSLLILKYRIFKLMLTKKLGLYNE